MSKSSDISICAPLLISIKGRSRMMAIRERPEPCPDPLSATVPEPSWGATGSSTEGMAESPWGELLGPGWKRGDIMH